MLWRRWKRFAGRNDGAVLRRILIFFGTGNGIGEKSDFPIICNARSIERVADSQEENVIALKKNGT